MNRIALLLALLLGLGSPLALALTLDEAKARGLVGEKVDGYIAAVAASPDPELQNLVTSTNEKRRQVYAELAQRNGISLEQVGILSGEKLRANAPAGTYVQQPSGQWQRK